MYQVMLCGAADTNLVHGGEQCVARSAADRLGPLPRRSLRIHRGRSEHARHWIRWAPRTTVEQRRINEFH